MALHVLIPCKALASGKSRLAPMLDPSERTAFCTALLRRTLNCALELVPPERCRLVSGDEAAAACAAARQVRQIAEPPGGGLNPALEHARDIVCAGKGAPELLILPIDLPFASAVGLRGLVEAGGEVVVVPDRRRSGTNLLYLGAAAAPSFQFRFGEASLAAHRAAAQECRLGFRLHEDADLGFDLDLPEDLRDWREAVNAARAPWRP